MLYELYDIYNGYLVLICKQLNIGFCRYMLCTSDVVFLSSIFETAVYKLHVCVLIFILLFQSVFIIYKFI